MDTSEPRAPFPLLELTDYAGQTPESIKNLVEHPRAQGALKADADLMLRRANGLFPEEYLRLFHQAALYEAAGTVYERLAEQEKSRYLPSEDLFCKAGKAYHFAGHAYRGLEDYRKAGEAYEKSGECYMKAALEKPPVQKKDHTSEASRRNNPLPAAIRSFSRAKGVWDDVGDYDKAGNAYFFEQRLMVELTRMDNGVKGIALRVWGGITGHGESIPSWFAALLAIMLAFAAIRWLSGINPEALQALRSSLQATLLMPGDVSTVTPRVEIVRAWIDIVQAGLSYFMLGLGIAIIVRKFSPR